MRSRDGRSLAELVLVFWLFAFVLLAVGRFLSVHGRLATSQRERVRVTEAVRTVAVVLGSEVRYLSADDMSPAAGDSLRLRATRGGGTVCGGAGEWLHVRYRGARLPDPAKDSVVLLTEGGTSAHAVIAALPDTMCGESLRLRLAPAPAAALGFLLVFEPGSYHLDGGALRYVRGSAGRQPLTEAIFQDPSLAAAGTDLMATLPFNPDSVRVAAGTRRLLVARLNGSVP